MELKQRKPPSYTKHLPLLLLTSCLVFASIFAFSRFNNILVCADGKTYFTKEWTGNVESITGNIFINDSTGKVWFDDVLPANHKIVLVDVPQGMKLMIMWKDWRGVQQEPYTVSFNNCVDYLKNVIPSSPPKSAQTNQNFYMGGE